MVKGWMKQGRQNGGDCWSWAQGIYFTIYVLGNFYNKKIKKMFIEGVKWLIVAISGISIVILYVFFFHLQILCKDYVLILQIKKIRGARA